MSSPTSLLSISTSIAIPTLSIGDKLNALNKSVQEIQQQTKSNKTELHSLQKKTIDQKELLTKLQQDFLRNSFLWKTCIFKSYSYKAISLNQISLFLGISDLAKMALVGKEWNSVIKITLEHYNVKKTYHLNHSTPSIRKGLLLLTLSSFKQKENLKDFKMLETEFSKLEKKFNRYKNTMNASALVILSVALTILVPPLPLTPTLINTPYFFY